MDNLTHTLTGVVLGRAGLERRFGRGTTLLLALASNLPDVDVILAFAGHDAAPSRRTLTHGVVGMPLLALGLAVVMRRACPRASLPVRFGLSLLGAGLHVFMDLLNSYGVELLYPLSGLRFELAWTFIIDLAMWGILLAPFVLARTPLKRLGIERLYRAAALALAAYTCACALGHARAETLLARTLRATGSAEFSHVFPEPLGPHRFRGVSRAGDEYTVRLLHVLDGRVETVDTVKTAAALPEIRAVRARPEAQRIERFFKAPVWRLDRERGVAQVVDLRFASAVLERRGDAFVYEFPLEAPEAQR